MVTIWLQFRELQNGYNLVTNRNKKLQKGYSGETPVACPGVRAGGRTCHKKHGGFKPGRAINKKNNHPLQLLA